MCSRSLITDYRSSECVFCFCCCCSGYSGEFRKDRFNAQQVLLQGYHQWRKRRTLIQMQTIDFVCVNVAASNNTLECGNFFSKLDFVAVTPSFLCHSRYFCALMGAIFTIGVN